MISAKRVTKRYGGRAVLEGLELDVQPGEVVGLLGPNGAGKTTTVKLLLGLCRPDSGELSLDGRPPSDPLSRARVGYAPEQPILPDHLTLRAFLDYQMRLIRGRRASTAEAEASAAEAGLVGALSRRVGEFSKGMRQRAALAAAALGEPAALILDEPTSGLDPVGRRDVREWVLSQRRAGRAVLMNSHLLSEVETSCDRVVILKDGRVAAAGRLDDLTRPSTRVELKLVSKPAGLAQDLASVALSSRETPEGYVLDLPGERVIPEVAAIVARHGAGMLSLMPVRDSLEDVFHRLMQADGSAGGAA